MGEVYGPSRYGTSGSIYSIPVVTWVTAAATASGLDGPSGVDRDATKASADGRRWRASPCYEHKQLGIARTSMETKLLALRVQYYLHWLPTQRSVNGPATACHDHFASPKRHSVRPRMRENTHRRNRLCSFAVVILTIPDTLHFRSAWYPLHRRQQALRFLETTLCAASTA